MAKRYKEKTKKKTVKKILAFTSISLVILGILSLAFIFGISKIDTMIKDRNETIKTKNMIENIDKNIHSDVLIIEELNKEMIEKLGKEYYIVKSKYKLNSLDKGTIENYYTNGTTVIRILIDIEENKISEINEIQDEELNKKTEIGNNIKENIKQDFEENKSNISEEKVLNIVVTDTEIIINTNYV